MKLYNHLSKKERQKIEFLLNNNYSIRNIAKELSRSPSTISREINRNQVNIEESINKNNNNNRNNNNNKNNNNNNINNKDNNNNKNNNKSNNRNSNNRNINNNNNNNRDNKDKNKDNNNNNNNRDNNKEYSWFKAQCRSKNIRFKDINNKIQKYPELQNYIIDKLNKKWSPEQISGRLKLERSDMYVSCGTIYSYIYKNSNNNNNNNRNNNINNSNINNSNNNNNNNSSSNSSNNSNSNNNSSTNNTKDLIKLLPNYNKRIYINNKCFIKKNTNLPSIHDRINSNNIDSWEVDLIHFGRKTKQNVTTLFNRLTKFVRLIKNIDGKADTVLEGIYNNSEGIKTLTLDRGIEFLRPQEIKEHNITPYYCDPMRPGQKGGVENTNRRLRRWLPKKMNIDAITQKDLDLIANEINNIPRKCIDYKTPKEFYESLTGCCTSG